MNQYYLFIINKYYLFIYLIKIKHKKKLLLLCIMYKINKSILFYYNKTFLY